MYEPILHWITHYGYLAIFLLLMLGIAGLPVPDETLLTFSGYLIFKGRLHPALAALAAFLGSACGISFSYFLGRTFGIYLIHRFGRFLHLTDERMNKAHEWFERAGRWSLTFGYFIPGVRHLTAYIAGASSLELPVFALFAYSGALLWSSTFLSLGYFIGDGWSRASEQAQHYTLAACAVVGVAAIIYWIGRKAAEKWRGRNVGEPK
jgi:membrane protein DedA with SNARE-associated domain